MKKVLITIITMLLPLIASADVVEIDGVWYNIITKGNIAEVTKNPSVSEYEGTYSGDIEIKNKISYEGSEYEVNKIGDYAFSYCGDLNSVTIPEGIISIGKFAFQACGLSSVTIPDGVISIGWSAFSGSSLTSVKIPPSLNFIDNYAFESCDNLNSVHISDLASWCNIIFNSISANPLNSAHHLFLDDKEIINLVIPDGVTTIGYCTFSGCESFKSIVIPESVTSIGILAFYNCKGITSINIPNSISYLCGFEGCKGLTSINIPNSVTTIGEKAFSGCTGLTSINIPHSVSIIEESAFSGCKRLKSVEIPEGVARIERYAFRYCDSLVTITFPNSLNYIGEYAFDYIYVVKTVKMSTVIPWITFPLESMFANSQFYVDDINI